MSPKEQHELVKLRKSITKTLASVDRTVAKEVRSKRPNLKTIRVLRTASAPLREELARITAWIEEFGLDDPPAPPPPPEGVVLAWKPRRESEDD